MNDDSGPLGTEIRFFTGLLESNVEALNRVLTDDFLLIDVMGGSEIPKAVLFDAIRSGQLKFETIERLDSRVRFYQITAVVTGSTQIERTLRRNAFHGTQPLHSCVRRPAK